MELQGRERSSQTEAEAKEQDAETCQRELGRLKGALRSSSSLQLVFPFAIGTTFYGPICQADVGHAWWGDATRETPLSSADSKPYVRPLVILAFHHVSTLLRFYYLAFLSLPFTMCLQPGCGRWTASRGSGWRSWSSATQESRRLRSG